MNNHRRLSLENLNYVVVDLKKRKEKKKKKQKIRVVRHGVTHHLSTGTVRNGYIHIRLSTANTLTVKDDRDSCTP